MGAAYSGTALTSPLDASEEGEGGFAGENVAHCTAYAHTLLDAYLRAAATSTGSGSSSSVSSLPALNMFHDPICNTAEFWTTFLRAAARREDVTADVLHAIHAALLQAAGAESPHLRAWRDATMDPAVLWSALMRGSPSVAHLFLDAVLRRTQPNWSAWWMGAWNTLRDAPASPLHWHEKAPLIQSIAQHTPAHGQDAFARVLVAWRVGTDAAHHAVANTALCESLPSAVEPQWCVGVVRATSPAAATDDAVCIAWDGAAWDVVRAARGRISVQWHSPHDVAEVLAGAASVSPQRVAAALYLLQWDNASVAHWLPFFLASIAGVPHADSIVPGTPAVCEAAACLKQGSSSGTLTSSLPSSAAPAARVEGAPEHANPLTPILLSCIRGHLPRTAECILHAVASCTRDCGSITLRLPDSDVIALVQAPRNDDAWAVLAQSILPHLVPESAAVVQAALHSAPVPPSSARARLRLFHTTVGGAPLAAPETHLAIARDVKLNEGLRAAAIEAGEHMLHGDDATHAAGIVRLAVLASPKAAAQAFRGGGIPAEELLLSASYALPSAQWQVFHDELRAAQAALPRLPPATGNAGLPAWKDMQRRSSQAAVLPPSSFPGKEDRSEEAVGYSTAVRRTNGIEAGNDTSVNGGSLPAKQQSGSGGGEYRHDPKAAAVYDNLVFAMRRIEVDYGTVAEKRHAMERWVKQHAHTASEQRRKVAFALGDRAPLWADPVFQWAHNVQA